MLQKPTFDGESAHLVIPVMRKSSLCSVLAHYVGMGTKVISSVTVVDFDPAWSTSEEARGLLKSHPHTYIAVPGQLHFNKSVALNIGINAAPDAMLLICDADVMIDIRTLRAWKQGADPANCFVLGRVDESIGGQSRSAPGILLAHKRALVAINGYSNTFLGWGKEDRDLLHRLALSGVTVKTSGRGVHLSHDEDERIRNYHLSDLQAMRARNARLLDERMSRNERYGTLDDDTKLGWEVLSLVN